MDHHSLPTLANGWLWQNGDTYTSAYQCTWDTYRHLIWIFRPTDQDAPNYFIQTATDPGIRDLRGVVAPRQLQTFCPLDDPP